MTNKYIGLLAYRPLSAFKAEEITDILNHGMLYADFALFVQKQ